jgi:hypothetical protein
MPLADTAKAIGVVTELLKDRLTNRSGLPVTAERIEAAAATNGKKLNVFLYEALFDPNLKNVPLAQEQPPPLWLVLKYLLTAFDDQGESDTSQAHEYLGQGVRALQELSFLPLANLPGNAIDALTDNPEPLKITFDETPSDLLSRVMQGSNEKYRFSLGFQVRPVMIVTREMPTYSLLVGVDYTQNPNKEIGEDGIQIPVIPSMGPRLTEVTPSSFEADPDPNLQAELTLSGNDLNLSGLVVALGPVELAVTAQQPNELRSQVDGNIAEGRTISAGSHPLSVVRTLPTGRRRSSNLLIADLLPKLVDAKFAASTTSGERGTLTLEGVLLGREEDDILVAFYQNGNVVRTFDEIEVVTPTPATDPEQTRLALLLRTADIEPGKYRIILRVNGQQAKASPEVDIP